MFVPERVSGAYKEGLIKHVASENDSLCKWATKLRRRLIIKQHLASSSASRWLAAYWLGKEDPRARMTRLLGNRFIEIIVDEAQDCGTDEFSILSFLREAGTHITMVADRDQAIYEFRRATPQGLSAFVTRLEEGKTLNGNFRSTPAICCLNNSLRSSHSVEEASGKRSSLTIPIYLVEFQSEQSIQAEARRLCVLNDIEPSEIVIVAHRRKDARLASGSISAPDVGVHKVIVIADAGRILRSRISEPRLRVEAIEKVERILIECIDGMTVGKRTIGNACKAIDLDQAWIREAATRVVMTVDAVTMSREVFTKTVRRVINGLAWPQHVRLLPLTTHLKTPSNQQWQQLDTTPQRECLSWGTVHSVKGQEFEAVGLVIKDLYKDRDGHTAIDDWRDGRNTEARRVLYVGASRAKRLLILAVHKKYASQVADVLKRDGVPYEKVESSNRFGQLAFDDDNAEAI